MDKLKDSLYNVIETWLDSQGTKELMKAEGLEDYCDLPHEMTDWAIKAMEIQRD